MSRVAAKKTMPKKAAAKTAAKNKSTTTKKRNGQVGASKLTYRPHQDADLPFLVDITLANMKKVFEQSVGLPLTEENIREQLTRCETTIIEWGGVPIGYYSYIVYQPERMYWGALIFDANVQGQGMGTEVVQHVYAEAKARGVKVIEGHVQTENTRAKSFWLKHGFEVVGNPIQGNIPIVKHLE